MNIVYSSIEMFEGIRHRSMEVLIELVSETHEIQELSDSSRKQFHQVQYLNELSSCKVSSSVIDVQT